jgi:RNA polymerase sigma-70 factor (ECF subfamily)
MKARAQPEPDEELIRRFQRTGDGECFAELFMRHRKNIYFCCRRFFGDPHAAEDATQETFLRAYRSIGSFREGDFAGWLVRIARNICIDEYRKSRPVREVGEVEAAQIPGASAESRLMADRIWQDLRSLAPEQRQCLEMKIEGYSYEETAARTGFSVEAVKSYIQNGRRMLWRKMEGVPTLPR